MLRPPPLYSSILHLPLLRQGSLARPWRSPTATWPSTDGARPGDQARRRHGSERDPPFRRRAPSAHASSSGRSGARATASRLVVLGGSTDARRLIPAMLTDLAELEVDAGDLGAARAFALGGAGAPSSRRSGTGHRACAQRAAYVALVEGEFDAAADNRRRRPICSRRPVRPRSTSTARRSPRQSSSVGDRRTLRDCSLITFPHGHARRRPRAHLLASSATYVLEEYGRHALAVAVAHAAHVAQRDGAETHCPCGATESA